MTAHIDAMSKEQAKNYLRLCGKEAHPKWTSRKIKSRINDHLESDQRTGPGVSDNSTTAGLDQKGKEKGLTVKKHDTIGSPFKKLRAAQEIEEKVSGETIVGFGRHADKKYNEVPQTYLEWTMTVVPEGTTACSDRWARLYSGKLARLATWARTQQAKPEESQKERRVEPAQSSVAASSAKGSTTPGRSRKRRAAEAARDEESPTTSSLERLQELVNSCQHLSQMIRERNAEHYQQLQARMRDLEQYRKRTRLTNIKKKQPGNPVETMPETMQEESRPSREGPR